MLIRIFSVVLLVVLLQDGEIAVVEGLTTTTSTTKKSPSAPSAPATIIQKGFLDPRFSSPALEEFRVAAAATAATESNDSTTNNNKQRHPKKRWLTFGGRHSVHFEEYRSSGSSPRSDKHNSARTDDDDDDRTLVLLLNGFGVGDFHQHKLIQELMMMTTTKKSGNDSTTTTTESSLSVFTMDYLGQGQSWPDDCDDGNSPSEDGLQYSGQLWVDQVITLLEYIILANTQKSNKNNNKVHVVGNSLGGHLSVHVAARRPDLVASVVLLNATPVWGLNLPGWSGRLWNTNNSSNNNNNVTNAVVLPFAKAIGRFLFDQIRKPDTIREYLRAAYANPTDQVIDDRLVQQIRDCTELCNGGHAAFASIMWSPPIQAISSSGNDDEHNNNNNMEQEKPFDAALARLSCNVLLCFGADDPWCTPPFAAQMLNVLQSRSNSSSSSAGGNNNNNYDQQYVELSNVGHCPNHEAPKAVAHLLHQWLLLAPPHQQQEQNVPPSMKLVQHEDVIAEAWGETRLTTKEVDDVEMTWLDRLAVKFV